MGPDNYRKQIELEILAIIEQKLKSREMEAERARSIAKYVLESLHPHMSTDQLRIAVDKMDDYFPELIPISVKITAEAEEAIKKTLMENVKNLLRQGKIDEAKQLIDKQ